jgi:hypothetical protein
MLNILIAFTKALFQKFLEETGWYKRITYKELTVEEVARNPKDFFIVGWDIYLDRWHWFPWFPFVYKVRTISWQQGIPTYTIGYQSGQILKTLGGVFPTAILRLEQVSDVRYRDMPVKVEFIDKNVVVTMKNGDIISNPLDLHPWLRDADPQKLKNVEYQVWSIWWPDIDEGLDIEGMRRNIPSHKIG